MRKITHFTIETSVTVCLRTKPFVDLRRSHLAEAYSVFKHESQSQRAKRRKRTRERIIALCHVYIYCDKNPSDVSIGQNPTENPKVCVRLKLHNRIEKLKLRIEI